MTLASTLIADAGRQLNDSLQARWTEAKLIGYINIAASAVVGIDPSASSVIQDFPLTANIGEYNIPAGTIRFLGGIGNLGSDGSTPGRSIRNTDRQTKDTYSPDWRTIKASTNTSAIKECIYDETMPGKFWVYPVPIATWHISVELLETPAVIDANTDPLPLSADYDPAMLSYVLYLAHNENTSLANKQESQAQLGHFYNFLSAKTGRKFAYPAYNTKGAAK